MAFRKHTVGKISRSLITMLWLFAASPSAFAFYARQDAAEGIFGVYGYVRSQDMRLDQIEEKFPELRDQVKVARLGFRLVYGDVPELAKVIISKRFPDGLSVLEKFEDDLRGQRKDPSDGMLTLESALSFLQTVESRARGNIEKDSTKRFLNAVAFYDFPNKEWSKFKDSMSFVNDSKAKGLRISVQAPRSWLSRESRLPNTLRLWQGENGTGPLHASVEVHKHEGPPMTDDLVRDLVSKGKVPRGLKPAPHVTFKNVRGTEISRYPAVLYSHEFTVERLGNNLFLTGDNLSVYEGDRTMVMTCGVIGENKERVHLKSEAKRFKSICQLFFNSLIIENRF